MTVNSHYIPKFYLRGFTDDQKPSIIWVYDKQDKRIFPSSINKIARENDFYAFTDISGREDKESIETYLTQHIENPANPILKKIRNYQSITLTEKNVLAKYLAVMFTRVPRHRERAEEIFSKLLKERVEKASEQLELELNAKEKNHELIKYLETSLHIYQNWANEMPDIFKLPSTGLSLAPIFFDMKWYFLTSSSKFITSDNPMIITEGKGLKPPSGEFVFPLCKDILLWGSWKGLTNGNDIFMPVSDVFKSDTIDIINTTVMQQATQYIFHHKQTEGIFEMLEQE